jgi:hypothetical protein
VERIFNPLQSINPFQRINPFQSQA